MKGDDFDHSAGRIERFQADEVLALTACSVRLEGWRSNKTAREFGGVSTSGLVNYAAAWIDDDPPQSGSEAA